VCHYRGQFQHSPTMTPPHANRLTHDSVCARASNILLSLRQAQPSPCVARPSPPASPSSHDSGRTHPSSRPASPRQVHLSPRSPGYHPSRILLCIAMVALTPPLVSSSSLKSSLCLARPSPSTSQQRSPRDHHYIGLDVLSFHPQRHDGMVPCSPLSPPPPLPPTQSRPALKPLATMTTPRSLLLPYLLRPLLLLKLLRFTFALDLVLVVAATI
jgi:hypothetical protein